MKRLLPTAWTALSPRTCRASGRLHWVFVIAFAACSCNGSGSLHAAEGVDARDWPTWRGPTQNGRSIETGLPDRWDPRGGDGSHVLWKREDLGGRSTPIVMNGKLTTIVRDAPETAGEGEKVVCVDAATGKTLWENRFNVYLSDVPDTRVGWSCCTGDPATGRVYALGVCGYFQCLDGETGKTLWSRSLHEEFGLLSTYGGRTNVPVLFEDLVIISAVVIGWGEMAKPAHRFLAMDKATGDVVWFQGTRLLPYDTTYSTPTRTVLGGQAALVFGSGDGALWAMQPRTGRGIWKAQLSRRGLNTSPLVVGDRIFMGHSEENVADTTMGTVVAVDALAKGPVAKSGAMDLTATGILWRDNEWMVGKSSPLMVEGRLIVIDDRATLRVLDADTGEVKAKMKLGTVMRSSPIYADGKVYLCTANGRWYTLRIDGDRVETVAKMRLPSGDGSYGSPIVSHGRLFVPTTGALYCLADGKKSPGFVATPPVAAETPPGKNARPAQLQIVPAELLLGPGEQRQVTVRLFDKSGRRLESSDVTYSLEGPGQIDAKGLFTAAPGTQHTATTLVAKARGLSGTARVRVVPPLPWHFDFEDGKVPLTWVGARYRHKVRKVDGNQVMVKVTTIPKGARSRSWMGPPGLRDYTIQADVLGSEVANKMPDIGLIGQRYTLDLMGAYQQLQIRSWVPVMRMAKNVPFAWKPNQWYTMKLRAHVETTDDGPRAILQGKVWPRDEAEPKAWTVEAIDTSPNRNGSPGLYGNAKDAEIWIDNLTVTQNDHSGKGSN